MGCHLFFIAMITLDRTKAPDYHPLEPIQFLTPEKHILSNGIPLYCISLGDQDVFKLELIFPAGAIYATKPGIASLTAQMLKRGTKTASSLELNEAFDFYGAYWEIQTQLDSASIVVYSLCKHLPKLMPLVLDILENSSINENDFEQEQIIEIQKSKQNWEKTSFAANQYFRNLLFEKDPYGRIAKETDLKAISHRDITSFYQAYWKGSHPTLILSGKITEKEIQSLNDTLGRLNLAEKEQTSIPEFCFEQDKSLYIAKENALQTSIRFGKIGITRNNPDYFKFTVLNTILGGFFGSRLQKNIREEKGFTYGISSSNVALQRGAYWVVGTDVNKENANQTIEEIQKEIKGLRTELVQEDELQLVKNYLMGNFIGELTQAFEISEKVKIICLENLPNDFYNEFQKQIMSCTSEDLIQLANKYLTEEMIDVRVG